MTDTPKITGDKHRAEAFIPGVWARHLETALRPSVFVEEWRRSPEGQRAAAAAERRRKKAAAKRLRVLARHAELVAAETHPVLAKLLGEHAPQEEEQELVCRTCPASDPDDWGDVYPAQAPCPTWKTIEAGA